MSGASRRSRSRGLESALALLVASLSSASSARAADPAVSVGASESIAAPDVEHYGVYPFVMGSLAIPAGPLVVSPGLGVEYCPELGRWGFIGAIIADLPVHEHVGIDAGLLVAHDQEGDAWGDALFSVGAGVGASFFVDRWSVSPMIAVLATPGEPGVVISPSIGVGYTFDLSSPPSGGAAVGSVK